MEETVRLAQQKIINNDIIVIDNIDLEGVK